MSMTDVFYSLGKSDALKLREEASNLDGTQITERETAVPDFDPQKDYTAWPAGSPVKDEGQVWTLLIPHNASHYPGVRPSTNRACWGLAHTKNPARAKAWVDSYGTSGLYMKDECYKENGIVYRSKRDNQDRKASVLPDDWEIVTV